MNFVIADVKNRRKPYTNMSKNDKGEFIDTSAKEVEARLLTLEQYHTLARRVIGKWAPAHVKTSMLGSEDAIDFVAHKIMIGDWDYDSQKSDIKTYRGYCGKMAIMDYIDKASEETIFITNMLDNGIDSREIYDIVPDPSAIKAEDKIIGEENRIERRNILLKFMNRLSNTQRACITLYYFNDMAMAEIGRHLGISTEGVRKGIRDGIKKMQKLTSKEKL